MTDAEIRVASVIVANAAAQLQKLYQAIVANKCMNCEIKTMNETDMLEALSALEPACRALAETRPGRDFSEHVISWRTPGGSGFSGDALYLTARGWALSPTPCDTASTWPTVADHLRTWRRPMGAAKQCLVAVMPSCSCH